MQSNQLKFKGQNERYEPNSECLALQKQPKTVMKNRKLIIMSDKEFEAYHPRTEQEIEEHQELVEFRQKFREWCKENEEDPETTESLERYEEIQSEWGTEAWWGNLDDDDREGHEHNMNKDD